jgi:hypothetical protein
MNKPPPTLADYLVIALSPVLIMALVGSLVFFLIEILYEGDYKGRLQWILFFFVFGIVLVSRISLHEFIGSRSPLYGLALGLVTWIGLQSFVEYPPNDPITPFSWAINLLLIGIAWWCAHRLTWDCTFIDESAEAGGEGVLQAAGLEQKKTEAAMPAPAEPEQEEAVGWWQRYRRYREAKKRRPHTPGVWVVYFSLAALPIFGLGQALMPVDDADGSKSAFCFWLMVVYVGSGLGLLLTTCFLGLRRYLRQRQLQMPRAMAGAWLTAGGVLILALLAAGAFLPRPRSGFLGGDAALTSEDRDASRYAQLDSNPGKGEGRPSEAGAKDKQGQTVSGDKADHKGGKSTSSGKDGSSDRSGKKDGSSGEKGDGKSKDRSDAKTDSREQKSGEAGDKQAGKAEERRAGPGKAGSSRSRSSSPSNPITRTFPALAGIANVLKWIVFGVLAVVVVFFLLRSGLQWLANFTGWAQRLLAALRNWWQSLFGLWSRREAIEMAEESHAAEESAPPRPFAAFSNPFHDGTAERRLPDELVRYSFAALDAWARECDLARQSNETPLEFVERVGAEVPALEDDARRLAALYVREAYARGPLTASCLPVLQQFWDRLEAAVEQPLSA